MPTPLQVILRSDTIIDTSDDAFGIFHGHCQCGPRWLASPQNLTVSRGNRRLPRRIVTTSLRRREAEATALAEASTRIPRETLPLACSFPHPLANYGTAVEAS